jgi:hypothetical protein
MRVLNQFFQSYNHFLILQNILPSQYARFVFRFFCCALIVLWSRRNDDGLEQLKGATVTVVL